MSTLITLCARGGSKGIPGKNIKPIAGNPLIFYSARLAKQYQESNPDVDIVLSTDADEIKTVVNSFGFNIDTNYTRPTDLASDKAGKIGAINDTLLYSERVHKKKYDFILDLDITSPLRNQEDIQGAFSLLLENHDAYNIFSVSPANRNPYFNMVEENANGFFSLCKQGTFLSRQTAPKVYDMNASFYFYRRSFFEKGFATVFTEKTLVYEVPHLCFDLDHPIDFEFMSFLLTSGKLDFDFR
ncbi:cytidylyltransferase domain-containing protein [Terrimonas rubra]|uniref:Cytidylyltransferase domain-containing protein n=1 Tax=Terrimonas rubra TaxID=1035890 RepID=A0ABW6A287_9BACT